MTLDSTIEVSRTARDTGEWLDRKAPLTFKVFDEPETEVVLVDTGTQYQTIIGFGGAFTEAAATTFYKMNAEAQVAILKAYFDPVEGNSYTLCRTHINSCDFSQSNYAYDEIDGDVDLVNFSIERDRQALIPFIRSAMQTAGETLKLFASPWSPPAWMKTNREMNHGGKLRPEYRRVWARYYARYIRAYAEEGIPIWGLTVQNEPEAIQTWDSCIYTAEEERDFVRDYLVPELVAAGLGDVRLMVHDHNRNHIYQRASLIYNDSIASQFVWGAAFHFYNGDNFDDVQRLHDGYPNKHLLFSEGAQVWRHKGEWEVGESWYARSIINDLNRWTEGWVDWNLLLDEQGGPNHVGNYCVSPILADTRRGDSDGVTMESSYAYIGHFSRFIHPGAKRVICAPTIDNLETTAFLNIDGRISVVVLNRTEKNLLFGLKYNGYSAPTEAPANSITTYCFAA